MIGVYISPQTFEERVDGEFSSNSGNSHFKWPTFQDKTLPRSSQAAPQNNPGFPSGILIGKYKQL